jgi:hypothetical protein
MYSIMGFSFKFWCDVMWCDVMWRDVTWCDVTWRDVTWRDVMCGCIFKWDLFIVKCLCLAVFPKAYISIHTVDKRSVLNGSITISCCILRLWMEGWSSLQAWRLAVNILNKHLWTASKGWSYSLAAWVGKLTKSYKMLHRSAFIWIRTGISGWLLWTQQWTFRSH